MIQKDDSSFIALFLAHPIPMWVYDLETLHFLAVNTAAVTHYGYTEAEFLGMTIKDIRPKEELARLRDNLRAAPLHTLEKSGTWQHLRKDGTVIEVDITSHPLSFNGRDCKFVLAHDVTARVEAEKKIARLNRIYAVLSRINSTIIRTRERAELYSETCRIAIEEGEFLAAYIFEIDPDTLDGAIVAHAGADLPLLSQTRLSARADTPDSGRPASRAAREGVAVVCNDVHAEPALAGWLERIGEQGRYALAALPLFAGRRVDGVLVLCTTVIGYFDEAELRLRVVAEGVETEGQLQFLRKRRCDEMQGYFFSPPVPAPAFESMLREGKQLGAAASAGEDVDTLLIVDDELNNLTALNRLLRKEGYRVLTADGGREGLRLLSMHRVQVIISDQRMPEMSGSEFLGIVKDLYPDTIRIMLSGYTDLASVTDSVNQGAVFKFMTKPWDDANLRKTIRDAFQRYWQVA